MAEETKSTPRPPETDGVSGRTFAKVRGRFNRSLANRKTTRGKRAGRWRAVVWPHLHIDDGSMGGGGPIPYDDRLNNNKWNNLYNNNGLDGFGNYGFTPERLHIFHYCIFAHRNAAGSSSVGGESFARDDRLVIYHDVRKTTPEVVFTFLHELGHNLLGHRDPAGISWDHNPRATHLVTDENNDGRFEHSNNGEVMDDPMPSPPPKNYCQATWNAIDLAWCL